MSIYHFHTYNDKSYNSQSLSNIIVLANSYNDALSKVEYYIKKSPDYKGNLKEYDIVLEWIENN